MTAGKIELFATGKQDILLTTKPEVSFFRQVVRRHTRFTIEPIKQHFKESVNFGKKISCKISNSGDLIGNTYLYFKLPPLSIAAGSTYTGWTNSLGYSIIEYIELEINGIVIDKLYDISMEVWDELSTPQEKRNGRNLMIGKFESVTQTRTNAQGENEYYVPIDFWFTRSPGNFLPMISLYNSTVNINVKLKPFSHCLTYDGDTEPAQVDILDSYLIVDYIYLEEEERKKFAKNDHIYYIDQIQFSKKESIKASSTFYKSDLGIFNHPVKELAWVFVEKNSEDNNDFFNFARRSDTAPLMKKATIKFENQDRTEMQSESYYRLVQNYRHTNVPSKYIYTYSFALSPDKDQPTGTNNFSMHDNVSISFEMNTSNPEVNFYIFARNYNILVISKGIVGVAYLS